MEKITSANNYREILVKAGANPNNFLMVNTPAFTYGSINSIGSKNSIVRGVMYVDTYDISIENFVKIINDQEKNKIAIYDKSLTENYIRFAYIQPIINNRIFLKKENFIQKLVIFQ